MTVPFNRQYAALPELAKNRLIIWLFCAIAMALSACAAPPKQAEKTKPEPPAAPAPVQVTAYDALLLIKHKRALYAYHKGEVVKIYQPVYFGDAPNGHKQFEGDERTPEGDYIIDGRNPNSSYHLSLRISYPNDHDRAYAAQFGRSPGGDIFIHGQPNGSTCH